MKRVLSVVAIVLLLWAVFPQILLTYAEGKKRVTPPKPKHDLSSLELIKNPSLMHEISKKTKEKNKVLKSKDSDGDGLNDYYERQNLLNKKLKDSNKNGISDDKEDSDKDKLTNLQEQKYNTGVQSPDTDADGLTDFDEVNTYHTNPTEKDSDKDSISDGNEVKKFKTNPSVSDFANGKLFSKFSTSDNFPKNKWNITGKISGVDDLSGRYRVRNSPILLINQMKAPIVFDITP